MINPAYVRKRGDILSVIPRRPYQSVLDVGCASGTTATAIRQDFGALRLTGIELDEELAQHARLVMDRVVQQDAESALEALVQSGERFDLVLCGDILEHLKDPWTSLRLIRELCPTGRAVVSLPNVAHLSTVLDLMRGDWPYRDRGILDRTHLRFFSRRNLPELFASASFTEERRLTRYRIFERPHKWNNRLEPYLARLPVVRAMTEYQYISLLR